MQYLKLLEGDKVEVKYKKINIEISIPELLEKKIMVLDEKKSDEEIQKIETDQDRVGGFSTFNNNFSYFSNSQNSTGTVHQQSVEDLTDYTTTEEQQDYQETYDSPTTTYEGESEYTATDMPTADGESEYAFVKTFMPNVERREDITFEKASSKRIVQKTKLKLNIRGKILVCAYSIIACLLVAFCIYNAVSISNIKSSLVSYKQEYSQTVDEVSMLQRNYDGLNSTTHVSQSNFVPVDEANTVKVQFDKRPTFVEIDDSTNWFDKVCSFLSKLF